MSVIVVTPSSPLVTATEAKAWAPVLASDPEARVTALLAVAQMVLEPPSWLGASLGEQELEFRIGTWPCTWERAARLPYGPVSAIVSVAYRDADGAEQALDPTVYDLAHKGTSRAHLVLKHGQTWPTVGCAEDAIRIRYKAGLPTGDVRLLPAKHAIVLSAVQLRSLSTDDLALRSVDVDGVDSRTYTVSDAAEKLIRNAIGNLLAGYRVWAV